MALAKKYETHPEFLRFSAAVDEAIRDLAARFDIQPEDLEIETTRLDMVSDHLVAALLSAWNVQHSAAVS